MAGTFRTSRRKAHAGKAKATAAGDAVSTYAVFHQRQDPDLAEAPQSGSTICPGLTLYHDAGDGLFRWHQTASHALVLTCYQFPGSYLSLAAGVGSDALAALVARGAVFLHQKVRTSRPITQFIRLNMVQDGERHSLHDTVVVHRTPRVTPFDLDCMPRPTGTVTDLWIDMIFSQPAMCEIVFDDLSLRLDAERDGGTRT